MASLQFHPIPFLCLSPPSFRRHIDWGASAAEAGEATLPWNRIGPFPVSHPPNHPLFCSPPFYFRPTSIEGICSRIGDFKRFEGAEAPFLPLPRAPVPSLFCSSPPLFGTRLIGAIPQLSWADAAFQEGEYCYFRRPPRPRPFPFFLLCLVTPHFRFPPLGGELHPNRDDAAF